MARSPNYPQHDLQTAINNVRRIWEAEQQSKMSQEVAASHLGFKGLNGSAQVAISALRKYGLLEGTGSAMKVSKGAITLLNPDGASATEYTAALRKAARAPKLFSELMEDYNDLPSEQNLTFALLKRDFNQAAAQKAARVYLETARFVNERSNGHTDDDSGDDDGSESSQLVIGDLVQWESNGVDQFREPRRLSGISPKGDFGFVEGERKGFPVAELRRVDPPTPPEDGRSARRPIQGQGGGRIINLGGSRQDVFVLDEGEAIIQWPEGLSQASFEDFDDWLKLVLRKVKRSVVETKEKEGAHDE